MPRNRIARRTFGNRSSGRLTEWFGLSFLTDFSTLAGNTFIIQGVMTAAELAKRPFTITRTIGNLWCRSDQVAAAELPFGALGGIVVSDKAVATGATAVPDPVTEVSSDEWFMYQSWAAGGESNAGAGTPLSVFSFDSRAQRKVADGEQFVIMMANSNGSDAVQFVLSMRILVKLS